MCVQMLIICQVYIHIYIYIYLFIYLHTHIELQIISPVIYPHSITNRLRREEGFLRGHLHQPELEDHVVDQQGRTGRESKARRDLYRFVSCF